MLTQTFWKQGVALSSRESVQRHVPVEEDHMEVDDVAPTGSGTFSISLLNEPDDLCSRFLFFSAGQPSVMDPAPPSTSDSKVILVVHMVSTGV